MTEIYTQKDKEEILRKTLEACNTRSELHGSFKKRLEKILIEFVLYLSEACPAVPTEEFDLRKAASEFVEKTCEGQCPPAQ